MQRLLFVQEGQHKSFLEPQGGCLLDATTLILFNISLFRAADREFDIDLIQFGSIAFEHCVIGLTTQPYG